MDVDIVIFMLVSFRPKSALVREAPISISDRIQGGPRWRE